MQMFYLLINEMEFSIYRFLTSGAKKPKNSFDRSSLGSTGSLAIGAFNAWQVTVTLYRTSIQKTNPSIEKEKLLEERIFFFFAFLDRTSTGKGEPINRYLSRLSRFGQSQLASTDSPFFARKPIFF